MFSLSRQLFSLNNLFVDKYKIDDSEYETISKTIKQTQEEMIKIVSIVEQLPIYLTEFITSHVLLYQSLSTTISFSSQPNEMIKNEIESSIDLYQNIQKLCVQYQFEMNLLITPLRTYIEQFNEMFNRLKVCDKRKEDYEYWNKKLNEINNKKDKSKTKGFDEIQKKFLQSKEWYEWLKEEIIEDVNKLIIDCQNIVLPIIKELFSAYNNFIQGNSEHWKNIPEKIDKFRNESIDLEYVIRVPKDSLIKDENCEKKKKEMIEKQFQQVPPSEIDNEVLVCSVPPTSYSMKNSVTIPVTNNELNNMNNPSNTNNLNNMNSMNNLNGNNQMNESLSNNQMSSLDQSFESSISETSVPLQNNQFPNENIIVQSVTKTTPLPPIPNVSKNKTNLLCRVLYDYYSEDQNELTIKEGDIIRVLSTENDWWIGELNGKTGQFPSNYVVVIQN